MKNNSLANAAELRHMAEKRLTSRPPPRNGTKDDTYRLVHEPQVYPIGLEIWTKRHPRRKQSYAARQKDD